ncbi:MAG TPA: dTDP-4-dehydrorhamnose reductase [Moraxellaceae bacterium]|nr:dTDP-4-dehydrorhamnose reductase [Moraxellaceae bacterium]
MILVTGAGGQLGAELQREGGAQVRGLSHAVLDITDATAVAGAMKAAGARLVINAAAWTDVDGAEQNPVGAFAANSDGPAVLARACAESGVPLFHVSTDHVFDGRGDRPWRESDPVSPLGVYGQSKAAGEAAIREQWPSHLIVRTSWVFGQAGENFVTAVLRRARSGDALAVVADQVGGPTPARALAQALLMLARRHLDGDRLPWGTWHFAGQPFVSRHAFAEAIVTMACAQGLLPRRVEVRAISSADRAGAALRPANACLDSSAMTLALGVTPPDWHAGLSTLLSELAALRSRGCP